MRVTKLQGLTVTVLSLMLVLVGCASPAPRRGAAGSDLGKTGVAHAATGAAFAQIPSPNGQRQVELHASQGTWNQLNASYDVAIDLIEGATTKALPSVPEVWPWVHRAEIARWLANDRVLLGWQHLYDVRNGSTSLKELVEKAAGVRPSEHFPVWSWTVDPSGTQLAVLGETGPDSGDHQATIVTVDLVNLSAKTVVSQPAGALKSPEEGWRSIYWSEKDGHLYFDGIANGEYTVFRWDGQSVQPIASGMILNGISPDGARLSALKPDRASRTVTLEVLSLDGTVVASTPVMSAPLTWWDKNGDRLAAYDATTNRINVWRLVNGSLVVEGNVPVKGERIVGVSDIRFNGRDLQLVRWGTRYDSATDTFQPDVAPDSVVLP